MATYSYEYLLCFLAASISFAVTTDILKDNLGIIGGREISIKEAPYMAALYGSKDFHLYYPICGGSIVHERFVLTAAHCIIWTNRSLLFNSSLVVVGTKMIGEQSGGLQIKVKESICHKEYNNELIKNDICLLKLQDPVTFGAKVVQIKLPVKDFELESGTKVNVSGWGITMNTNRTYSPEMSQTLRQVTIKMVSEEKCRKTYRLFNNNTTLCAGDPPFGHCDGDSGGPLTYNNIQIGIVSFSRTNGNYTKCGLYPGGYVKVASYIDWINSTITDNLKN